MVVDGEHYPPVIEYALSDLTRRGHEVEGAVLAGGGEKLPAGGSLALTGVDVTRGPSAEEALTSLLEAQRPYAVMDLSDEPVLDYRR